MSPGELTLGLTQRDVGVLRTVRKPVRRADCIINLLVLLLLLLLWDALRTR